jgi:serine/threonine-protein kinase
MGVVFAGEDTRLHRRVALKVVAQQLAADPAQRERLRREARAAAALAHPGIATIFALEEIDGHLFIVSEFLQGQTLRAELAGGPLPVLRALDTARTIAHALAAAHERGIVHRDLKPENVMRTQAGDVKVLDFGLAQFEAPARDLLSATALSEAGRMAGTPPYMSPEQLLGGATDFRTDQFAFGVLLYEMVEGRRPFGGGSLPSVIAQVLTVEPLQPHQSGTMPDDVWRIVQQCVRKDPAERFEQTSALVAALDAAIERTRASQPTPKGPRASALRIPAASTARDPQSLWWWQCHQAVLAALHWAMVWPAWHVRGWLPGWGLWFFFAVLVSVIVAANLRLHLWFSSRVYPAQLAEQRVVLGRWITAAEVIFSLLMLAGGAAMAADHVGWGALFIGFGIGSAISLLVIEPATTRAAFGT